MAVVLPHSIYIHLMKTGGWSVRGILSQMKLNVREIGRCHDPAHLLPLPARKRPFIFVFIRHPLSWYRSYWAYRMQVDWKVQPNQTITGWQTFGSILDHECRANDFTIWMQNVLDYVPEGFLSRIYHIYTDEVDFVGRVESFNKDLSRALTHAGEEFSPEIISSFPKRNATGSRFIAAATFPPDLARRVMVAESYITERWGYRAMPRLLIATSSKKANPSLGARL